MKEILELALSGFWKFIGFTTLFTISLQGILNLIVNCYNRYLRNRNIKRQGWPPEYLDADGDHVEYIKAKQNN